MTDVDRSVASISRTADLIVDLLKRRRVRDQDRDEGNDDLRTAIARSNGTLTKGGVAPGGTVGARRIVKLPEGELTSFFISQDDDGSPCLFQHVTADDLHDPGKTNQGAGLRTMDFKTAQRQAKPYYDHQRATLSRMQEANKKLWGLS